VALQLIYLVCTKLLSWMVLRTRSDTTKEIEILILRHQLLCCSDAVLDLGSAGPTEPCSSPCPTLWVPETVHTARDLPVRPR
jgi:hypothetical protein